MSLPINLENIVAWFDPQNLIKDMSNNITKWRCTNNSNYDLSIKNNIVESIPYINNNNLSLVSLVNNGSYLKAIEDISLAGFICIIRPRDNGNGTFDTLFGNGGNDDNERSFRYARIYNNQVKNDQDIDNSLYINGSVYNNGSGTSYDNTNKYTILYVKMKNLLTLKMTLGSYYSSTSQRGFMGYIGDFICLSSGHTDDERILLEGYLAWKWGLQNNLPTNHLYYNNPTEQQKMQSQQLAQSNEIVRSQQLAQSGETFRSQPLAQSGETFRSQPLTQSGETFRSQQLAQSGETFRSQQLAQSGETFRSQPLAQSGETFRSQQLAQSGETFRSQQLIEILVQSQEISSRLQKELDLQITNSQNILRSQQYDQTQSRETEQQNLAKSQLMSSQDYQILTSQHKTYQNYEASHRNNEEIITRQARSLQNEQAMAQQLQGNVINSQQMASHQMASHQMALQQESLQPEKSTNGKSLVSYIIIIFCIIIIIGGGGYYYYSLNSKKNIDINEL